MHRLFYEKRTEGGTDGSNFKSNLTQEPGITVCKQYYWVLERNICLRVQWSAAKL